MVLFGDPALLCLAHRLIGIKACNALTVISEGSTASRVGELACSRQMFGPSFGSGGELVAPHERRNTNGSALTVMHGQDAVYEIRAHISGIVSRICHIGRLYARVIALHVELSVPGPQPVVSAVGDCGLGVVLHVELSVELVNKGATLLNCDLNDNTVSDIIEDYSIYANFLF